MSNRTVRKPGQATFVTDIQGKLIESHVYDSQNSGLTSQRASGADNVSVMS